MCIEGGIYKLKYLVTNQSRTKSDVEVIVSKMIITGFSIQNIMHHMCVHCSMVLIALLWTFGGKKLCFSLYQSQYC